MAVQLVWFKRDLRVADHRPLAEAAAAGPVLPLHIAEPDLWRQADASGRQWAFVRESLLALRADLGRLGMPLVVRSGEAVAVLDELHRRFGLDAVWAHQETGNAWTYARDRAVRAWAGAVGIPVREFGQDGVVRALPDRAGWAEAWEAHAAAPRIRPPALLRPVNIDHGPVPTAFELGLAADPCPGRQPGGRRAAVAALTGFLEHRGADYPARMSSPLTAFDACSRLSPHLAWGTLSLREAAQAARRRAEAAPGWGRSVAAFLDRLRWRSHMMQKLESEPRLEFENLHPAYDGLHPALPDPLRFEPWTRGETGYPLVDAAMRCLAAEGWINFRMRALLVSFACHHLWLGWRAPGEHLARLFVDYEPGIHWYQMQMQAATSGVNTPRIYNPVRQSQELDPDGVFIRRWVPALARVPAHRLHEPWRMTAAEQQESGCLLDRDYPRPVVDHVAAGTAARDRIWAVRQGAEYDRIAQEIQRRHGSAAAGLRPSNPSKRREAPPGQTRLRV